MALYLAAAYFVYFTSVIGLVFYIGRDYLCAQKAKQDRMVESKIV